MNIEYIDFDVEVEKGAGGDYPVAVRSLSGEARGIMRLPFGQLELENHLLRLQNALLRSGGERRQQPLPDQADVQLFGQALFDALLAGDIRGRFEVCQEQARRHEHTGLRLRLHIQAPDLAALPWEYLYSRDRAEYVCLSRYSPVVRYLNLPQPPEPLTVKPPLRILGLIANPSDLKALNTKVERQRLETALDDLSNAGLAELQWLPGQTWRDLQRALREGPWHVLHFIGHGGFDRNLDEGNIFLADDQGRARPLGATELARLLSNHRYLRLAVLNSCEGAKGSNLDVFSSTASILVRGGIPAVVAMQYEITDDAAIELSRTFYESLAGGWPVDASLAEARVAISVAVPNTIEWGTPVLHMRAPDGVLFRLVEEQSRVGAGAPLVATVSSREDELHDRAKVVARPVLQSHYPTTTRHSGTTPASVSWTPETRHPALSTPPVVTVASGDIEDQTAQPEHRISSIQWVISGCVLLGIALLFSTLRFVIHLDPQHKYDPSDFVDSGALGFAILILWFASSVAIYMASRTGAEFRTLLIMTVTSSILLPLFMWSEGADLGTAIFFSVISLSFAWSGLVVARRAITNTQP